MRRNLVVASLVALAAAAGIVWLLRPPAVIVETASATRGAMEAGIDAQGETRAHDRYLISSPVAGRLTRIELHDGDAVREGQVLARVAAVPLSERQKDEQAARVAAAEAVLREAEERARHAEDDAQQATRERVRVEKLVADGFVSPQAAERARNAEKTGRNEADAARHRARAAAADVRNARAGLPQRDGAQVEVRAPADSRVLRIVDASERVVAAGTALMTLGDLSRLEIVLDVLSTEAVRIRPGMEVVVLRWGGSGTLAARVRSVEPHAFTKVSALGVEEKRTNVIADFAAPPPSLGDGFRVDARIVTWRDAAALRLPASALFRCDDAWCVYAVEEGRARRRRLAIGERNDREAQVTEGVREGETVIRFPGSQVGEGTRVRPAGAR